MRFWNYVEEVFSALYPIYVALFTKGKWTTPTSAPKLSICNYIINCIKMITTRSKSLIHKLMLLTDHGLVIKIFIHEVSLNLESTNDALLLSSYCSSRVFMLHREFSSNLVLLFISSDISIDCCFDWEHLQAGR